MTLLAKPCVGIAMSWCTLIADCFAIVIFYTGSAVLHEEFDVAW